MLYGETNLGKLNVNLITIGWVCSKMAKTFEIMRFKNQMYLTNGSINWTDESSRLIE